MGLFFASFFVPILLTVAIRIKNGKRVKKRGVRAEDAGGEHGITMRNHRFPTLVETPWEDADTLALIFEEACAKYASGPLLGTRTLISKETEVSDDGRTFEKVCLGNYMWATYGQTFQRVENFASGLITIGHRKGERIALFAETRAEWFIALQGCFRQNFTVVTLYASLGEEALAYSLNETEVTTVICDRKQLKKLLDLGRQLFTLKRVIYIDDEFNQSEPVATGSWTLKPFVFVENLGRNAPVAPNMPEAADIAVIMYTSGSTGMPKGVMMSHKNVVATVAGIITIVPNIGPGDVYLAYLPLAHILELCAENIMCATGAAIGYGSPLTLTDTSSKIKKGTKGDASALRPTLMTAVPAILDRVRDGVRKKVDSKGGLPKKLFGLAYRRRLSAIEGNWFGAWGLEKYLWDFLVFKNVRMLLGGRVRGLLSGGAPLSGDTQRFINICFGAPIGQGYGLTETSSGATFSEWDDASVGRVGPPVPHCYVKLIDWEEGGYLVKDSPLPRGEIVVGGPSVSMGYFNNQDKTDEVYKVDEKGMRWFYTGDIGQFHVDGCLEIVDRKKDIVKLQHGEYVSLGKVEAILAASRYVVNIMMHADPFHSFCVALIVPSQAELEDWAKQEGIKYADFKDLCQHGTANKEVLKSLSVVGKQFKLDKFEIPLKLKLLEEPWTPESGLVTAALKLKRENVKKTFADDLKHLYD